MEQRLEHGPSDLQLTWLTVLAVRRWEPELMEQHLEHGPRLSVGISSWRFGVGFNMVDG